MQLFTSTAAGTIELS